MSPPPIPASEASRPALAPAQWPRRALAVLRPDPHRGDVIAAAALVLAVAALMVNVRMDQKWAAGVLLVASLIAAAPVWGMGLLAPSEDGTPRPYRSVLLLAGLALVAAALYRAAQVLGSAHPLGASGTVTWVGLALVAAAVFSASRSGSAACVLLAGIVGAITALAFVQWAFDPSGASTFRYILLLVVVVAALLGVSWRDRRRRHAVAMIDVAGLAALGLGLTFLALPAISLSGRLGAGRPGLGWAVLLLAVGCGLIAYAAVDREPGPGYLGVLVLGVTVATVGRPDPSGGSLLGWPILLALIGTAGVMLGLRPRGALPPSPDAGVAPAPAMPLGGAPGGPHPAPSSGGPARASAWTEKPARPPAPDEHVRPGALDETARPAAAEQTARPEAGEQTAPLPTPEGQPTQPLPDLRRDPGAAPTEPQRAAGKPANPSEQERLP